MRYSIPFPRQAQCVHELLREQDSGGGRYRCVALFYCSAMWSGHSFQMPVRLYHTLTHGMPCTMHHGNTHGPLETKEIC